MSQINIELSKLGKPYSAYSSSNWRSAIFRACQNYTTIVDSFLTRVCSGNTVLKDTFGFLFRAIDNVFIRHDKEIMELKTKLATLEQSLNELKAQAELSANT